MPRYSLQRLKILLATLYLISSAPTQAQSPYPILFIHGLGSDNTMWDHTIAEIGERYGISAGEVAPPIHASLNFNSNVYINNLGVQYLQEGQPFPAASDADIAIWFPQTSSSTAKIWSINFQRGSDGSNSDSNETPLLGLVAEPNPAPGSFRSTFRLKAGAARATLHKGQYVSAHLNSSGVVIETALYLVVAFDQDPVYNVTLEHRPGQPDPGDPLPFPVTESWTFALQNLSNEEAILKQAVALSAAISFITSATGSERVILVAHSMGGLAARAYLQWGRTSQVTPGSLWVSPTVPGGHKVAKLLTLGTPHGGANGAEHEAAASIGLDPKSNAARDLAYDYNDDNSYEPDNVPANASPGVFLLGGLESTVPVPEEFYSDDISCDDSPGNGNDDLTGRGLNWPADGNRPNGNMPLPDDVEYFAIAGYWPLTSLGNSDGAVLLSRQIPDSTVPSNETKVIVACHSFGFLSCFCWESHADDAIIEGLDEADVMARAWSIPVNISFRGFLTHQGDGGEPQDSDFYRFTAGGVGEIRATIDLESPPTATARLRGSTGEILAEANGALSEPLEYAISHADSRTYYLEIEGEASASNASAPCFSSAPNCENGYRVSLTTTAGATTLDLIANPTTVSLGSSTSLIVSVRTAAGGPAPSGLEVYFQTATPGSYTGCAVQPNGSCLAPTNGSGQATATFSASVAGTSQITTSAPTGGSDTVSVTFALGGVSASASPNPQTVAFPSTISVQVRNAAGNPVGAGVPVTYSTSFPGIFGGNGAGTSSPQTLLTAADGTSWIRFTGTASGTANVTIETPSATPTLVPIAFAAPSSNIQVNLAVAFAGGTPSTSDYELEALILDSSGAPILGEPVTFTTSRGTLLQSNCNTGPTGVCDVTLQVATSGDVTVTATARSITAATTFFAQVGQPSCADMFPVQTLSLPGEVLGVAYTSDGSVLVAAEYNGGMVRAFNTSDWSIRWTRTTSDDRATQVSISPDNTMVLVNHDDGQDIINIGNGSLVCRTDLATGEESINGTFVSNSAHFYASDGVSGSSNPAIYRHGSLCGSAVNVLTLADGDDFQDYGHMDFSATKNWVAVGSHNGNLYVRAASNGALVRADVVTAGQDNGYDVDFDSSGSRLLAVGDRVVKAFNTSNWSFTSYTPTTLSDRIYGAKFLDNDSKIGLGGQGKLEILNAAGGSCYRKASFSGDATEIDWSSSRSELAVATRSGSVLIFKPLVPPDSQPPIINVTHPPDGWVTNQTSVTTTGVVTDASVISSFTINGTPVALGTGSSFSQVASLAPGINIIQYAAMDLPGNSVSVSRSVTRQIDTTPPVVSNVGVTPSSALAGTMFTISAAVVDGDTGVASVTATVKSSGGATVATLPMGGGPIFTAAFNSAASPVGFYTVDLAAVDSSPQANTRVVTGAAGFEVEPPPSLAVSPESIALGVVFLGDFMEGTFTVSNTGGGTIDGAASTGAPFSIVSGSPYVLARGQSTQVVVRFTPDQIGPASATVTFTGAGGATRGVSGTGAQHPGVLDVAPMALDFEAVQVGSCRALTVTASNIGSGPLAASVFAETPFAITSGAGFNLAPGTNTPIEISFCPIELGARSSQALFVGGGGATVTLSGFGFDASLIFANGFESGNLSAWSVVVGEQNPILTVTPASIDFGTVAIGQVVELPFTVQNTGSGMLSGIASTSSPFSIVSGSPYNLGAGLSTQVNVRFTPTAPGVFDRGVTFTGGSGVTRGVSGTGHVPPAIDLNPPDLDFGSVSVGSSADLSFTVFNVGGGTLTGSATTDPPFAIVSGSPYSILGGDSKQIAVRFSPETEGPFVDTVAFSGGGDATGGVSGNGSNLPSCTLGGPDESSTLLLVSGNLNGQTISVADRSILVDAGSPITGTISYEINSAWPSSGAMVTGMTPSWGDHAASFTSLGGFGTPVAGLLRQAAVNYTAPMVPGTYHIILAYHGEFSAAQVMSATNWALGEPVWNNGDDIASWSPATVAEANASGRVCVNYLPSERFVPATAVEIVVAVSGATYLFNEGNGTIARDSRNDHDATVDGAVWTSGYANGALTFGTPDTSNVAVPRSVFDGWGNSAYFEAWIYPTAYPASGNVATIFRKRGAFNDWSIELKSSGALNSYIASEGGINGVSIGTSTTTTVPLNQWTKVASHYDGGELHILVNDVVVASLAGTLQLDWDAPTCPSDGFFTDGCYYGTWIGAASEYSRTTVHPNYRFFGKIDEVLIHSGVGGGASILAADSFDDGIISGWTTYGTCWSESAGLFRCSSTPANAAIASVWSGGSTWSDYAVEVDVKPLGTYEPSATGIIFRFQNEHPDSHFCECNLYRFQGTYLSLYCTGGPTYSTPFAFNTTTFYRLRATVSGSNATCEVVGAPGVSVGGPLTAPPVQGSAGLRSTHIASEFDNFVVSQ